MPARCARAQGLSAVATCYSLDKQTGLPGTNQACPAAGAHPAPGRFRIILEHSLYLLYGLWVDGMPEALAIRADMMRCGVWYPHARSA